MHSDRPTEDRPIGTPGWWAEPSLPPGVAGLPDWSLTLREPPSPGARFDPSVPHPARVYNYWLGGKDHFDADRRAAEEVIRHRPEVVAGARANGAFLARVVRYLAVGPDILTRWLPSAQWSSSSILAGCSSAGTLVTYTAGCSPTHRAWRTSSPQSVPAGGIAAMISERTSGTPVTGSPVSILSTTT